MSSSMIKSENIVVDTTEYNSDEGDEVHMLEDTGGEYHTFESMPSPLQRNVVTVNHNMTLSSNGKESSSGQPKNVMENEKRMRREIANSNERRRMQSINAGFQSLRGLLPHHEGEKLSKAAILQQTSQYIIDLEREKTHLLSQNCQLKRLLGQHEIVNNVADNSTGGSSIVLKKRKLTDNVMTVQTISDSSDEGLGSMSPEPVTLLTAGGNVIASKVSVGQNASSHIKEMTELKTNLQTERKQRSLLEERIRQLEQQIYPSNQFIEHEVIEHTDNVREEEISLVEIDQSTQIVLCSPVEKMHEEEAEMLSDMNLREEVILSEETIEPEYVDLPSRLQPILEAAIKAEPKVEVERINETVKISKINGKDGSTKQTNGRMFVTTSRQNLDTIVEAIRHLEGDHMFESGTSEQLKKARKTQEVPLALTKVKQTQQQSHTPQNQRKLKAELSPFLQLKNPNGTGTITIVSSSIAASSSNLPLTANKLSTTSNNNNSNHLSSSSSSTNITLTNKPSNNNISNNINATSVSVLPSTIVKFPSSSATSSTNSSSSLSSLSTASSAAAQVTITTSSLKQCRPGVIVAKQIS